MNVNEKFDKVYIPYLLLFLFDYIIVWIIYIYIKLNEI